MFRKNKETSQFIDFLTNKGMKDISIHTSGHADLDGLKKMVKALNPKHLVPIHTFEGDKYQDIFDQRLL
jgi:ribonuclease J